MKDQLAVETLSSFQWLNIQVPSTPPRQEQTLSDALVCEENVCLVEEKSRIFKNISEKILTNTNQGQIFEKPQYDRLQTCQKK